MIEILHLFAAGGSGRKAAALCIACVAAWPALAQETAALPRLTRSQAEAIALRRAPEIGAAYFRAQAANETVREARSGLFPQVNLDVAAVTANPGARLGATGYLNNSSVFNRESDGVNISQLITDFGRTLDLTAASRLTALSAAERLRLTRQQVVLIVDVAYFSALRAQSLLRVATETVNARGAVSEQAAALAKRKLRSELDVSFAQANLAEARLLVLEAEDAVNASIADLSAALGSREMLNVSLVDEPAEGFPKGDPEQMARQALEQRPEAAALRDERAASVKMVDAERAARFPRVTALGAFGDTPEGDTAVRGRFTAGGVNVEFPAFTGGLLSARQREAQFRSAAAGKDLENEEEIIVRDVHLAWLSASTALKRIPVAREFLQSASQSLELAGARYRLGLTSIVEMTQAQLAQTQAQIEFASAKYDYQVALHKLRFQIGNIPTPEPAPGLRYPIHP